MAKKKREHLLNDEIKASEVRLPEEGIIKLSEALRIAEEQEMDLVMMNQTTSPPICRILNYEKFIYEQNKAKKANNKAPEIKEIKLGLNISNHDLLIKIKQTKNFLLKGHRIKLSLQLKGREMSFKDNAMQLILKTIIELEENGNAEGIPKIEGKKFIVYIKPKNN